MERVPNTYSIVPLGDLLMLGLKEILYLEEFDWQEQSPRSEFEQCDTVLLDF